MFNRMYIFLLQNDILYKNRFGFRKGFSTSLALVDLFDFHRDNHDFLIGMFLPRCMECSVERYYSTVVMKQYITNVTKR